MQLFELEYKYIFSKFSCKCIELTWACVNKLACFADARPKSWLLPLNF